MRKIRYIILRWLFWYLFGIDILISNTDNYQIRHLQAVQVRASGNTIYYNDSIGFAVTLCWCMSSNVKIIEERVRTVIP